MQIHEEQYIDALVAKAMNHKAVYHPYLLGLKEGLFPDMKFAFKDFAWQYFHYSSNFSVFLRAVSRDERQLERAARTAARARSGFSQKGKHYLTRHRLL